MVLVIVGLGATFVLGVLAVTTIVILRVRRYRQAAIGSSPNTGTEDYTAPQTTEVGLMTGAEGPQIIGIVTVEATAEVVTAGSKVLALVDLCRFRQVEAGDGSWTDADTLWPSEVMAVLDGDLTAGGVL